MKIIRIEQKASQQAKAGFRMKRPVFWVLVLCLLIGSSMAVSASLLGSSISRFSKEDTNVISLVPPEEASPESERNETGGFSEFREKSAQEESTAAGSTVLPQYTTETTNYIAVQSNDNILNWNSETQVNMFKDSYDGTVESEDKEKVIAPGTSNFYDFTLQNNGYIPLDYTVFLEVGTYLGEQDIDTSIPLEWRLLAGDGTTLSDWRGYNERTKVVERGTLEVRHQDNYTVEWRWDFERGEGMDAADTNMGNMAVDQSLDANAVISVYAEQSADWDGKIASSVDEPKTRDIFDSPLRERESKIGETLHRDEPKTGDNVNIFFYIVLMVISACVMLIVFVTNRRRRKDEDVKDGQK